MPVVRPCRETRGGPAESCADRADIKSYPSPRRKHGTAIVNSSGVAKFNAVNATKQW